MNSFCCVCGSSIDSTSTEVLSAAVQLPVCADCARELNEIRFGRNKIEAAKSLEKKAGENVGIDGNVVDYLVNSVGIGSVEPVRAEFITSGYSFEGYRIVRYLGMTSGDCVLGTGFISSAAAGLSDAFGAESDAYGTKVARAKDASRKRLTINAAKMRGNAVIGVDFDVFDMKGLVAFSANGTVVVVEPVAP